MAGVTLWSGNAAALSSSRTRILTPMATRKYLKGEARIQVAVALKKQYEEGATIRQIAKETGYTTGRVAGLLWFAGTRMRPSATQRED